MSATKESPFDLPVVRRATSTGACCLATAPKINNVLSQKLPRLRPFPGQRNAKSRGLFFFIRVQSRGPVPAGRGFAAEILKSPHGAGFFCPRRDKILRSYIERFHACAGGYLWTICLIRSKRNVSPSSPHPIPVYHAGIS